MIDAEYFNVQLKSDVVEETRMEVVEDDDNDTFTLRTSSIFGDFLGEGEDVFSALVDLRKQLESNNISILCEGSAVDVYPSPMQFSFGNTMKAYKMELGKQALNDNLVSIFDVIEQDRVATIEEQLEYKNNWLQSLR